MNTISSILVANRGEIACRIMRTAKQMGIETIAVYSDADRGAPHVTMADQAVFIGPAPVDQSYLRIEAIIDAAKSTGADAIHPGYGFLSENADFARACARHNIIFIGPSPEAIEIMGSKAAAKEKMLASDVPCVPGYNGDDQSENAFLEAAGDIGFPVMVKASAGGGGRGMRLVTDRHALKSALALARSEAENAFGDGHLIVEKALIKPRHIEIQIFGDSHGTIIHLGERDCSLQRRHQKIFEEAPSPVVSTDLRAKMGDAAIKAAKAVDYVGAGTVEFLLDEGGHFYFLEMNTRLQVEHPVSEIVTGLDFVALQIRVAEGKALDIDQSDVQLTGHAIEARLYCEDPANDFLPATGHIDCWRAASGDGVRVDAGVATGSDISPFYDPMVAKVIGHGATRDIALRNLVSALEQTDLFGPKTNIGFLLTCLSRERFKTGAVTTGFLSEEFPDEDYGFTAFHTHELAIAAVVEHSLNARHRPVAGPLRNWASAGRLCSRSIYHLDDTPHAISVTPDGSADYSVTVSGDTYQINVMNFQDRSALIAVDGRRYKTSFHSISEGDFWLNVSGKSHRFQNLIYRTSVAGSDQKHGNITAPMHGLLLEFLVSEGDSVAAGQPLAILEAMKMQHEIRSEIDGRVASILATAGTQVAADSLLIEVETEG